MKKKDKIFSKKLNKILATVEIQPYKEEENSYDGRIIENDFPEELKQLFKSYDELVNDMVFPVADTVAEKIEAFGLVLVEAQVGMRDIHVVGEEIWFRGEFQDL